MGEKLATPPLIEAVCEFRFAPSASWDWTIPGRLYDQISKEFSDRSELQGMQLQLTAGPGGQAAPQLTQGPPRVQMKRPDGSAMVQVGPHLLAVNQLRPYPHWPAFQTMILRVFDHYVSLVAEWKLARVGLRYINQIDMTDKPAELGTVISVEPNLTGALDRSLAGFYQRYDLLHDSPPGILVLQTGIRTVDAGTFMMIDLDYGSREEHALANRKAIEEWLDAAHHRIHESFVQCLNPDLYRRLKEGNR